jgi:Fur family transcriptional regulator, ferric uptake regulator
MKSKPRKPQSAKLERKSVVFDLLDTCPSLTANELKVRAEGRGIRLSLASAYRLLQRYNDTAGNIEQTETRYTKLIAAVLQAAEEGDHLSVVEIKARVAALNHSLDRSTIYRVLAKLGSLGCVQTIDRGRVKVYEWRRDRPQHGHLTCVECGMTIEFVQDYLYEVCREIAAKRGYDFSGIELLIRSICERCLALRG